MKEGIFMADLNEGLGLKKTYDEDKSVEKETELINNPNITRNKSFSMYFS